MAFQANFKKRTHITTSKVSPADGTMMTAHVIKWCVIDTVMKSFWQDSCSGHTKKMDILIGMKAVLISGDCVGLLRDTYTGRISQPRKISAAKPLVGSQNFASVVPACSPDCKKLSVGNRKCGITKRESTSNSADRTFPCMKSVNLVRAYKLLIISQKSLFFASHPLYAQTLSSRAHTHKLDFLKKLKTSQTNQGT